MNSSADKSIKSRTGRCCRVVPDINSKSEAVCLFLLAAVSSRVEPRKLHASAASGCGGFFLLLEGTAGSPQMDKGWPANQF